ncbi:alpha/beta hydrolase [Streptomyces hokutonensis]|uniref:Alpha/beta hydrolase n=1 Tax=Streptomyces hokutonensis TaxID=1306990 RepID=A0ABW6MMC8_9ACTN
MSDSQDDGLRELYASFTRRLEAEPEMSIDGMRALFEQWHLATAEPTDVTYRESADAPVPATWCVPLRSDDSRVIIYTHGGGFVVGSRHSHRKLAGHLATRCATPVFVIDYRRAPEHPYPAQVEDTVSVAKWLMKTEGLAPADIAFAGDSAGGNIAVSSALRLSQEGLAPAAVVAMSPWFDMENSAGSLDENAQYDAMVDQSTLKIMTGLVLNGQPPRTPGANPLYADLSALPPTLVTTSQHETLRDDATRFAARAKAAGRDITLFIEPNAQHVFQMAVGRAIAADRSLEQIGEWVRAMFTR